MLQVNAGDLKHYVEVWHRSHSGNVNDLGADTVVDEIKLKAWMKLETRTGSLLTGRTAESKLSKTTHKFLARFNRDITPDCWIMFDGHRYDIDYVSDPNFDRQWMEIFCQEVMM